MSDLSIETIDDSARTLVARLGREGVRLWVDGDRLRYVCSNGVLSPDSANLLRAHRDDVIAELRRAGCTWMGYPTSHGQRSLWYQQQLEGVDDTSYHLLVAVPVVDDTPVERISLALHRALRRHEALRMVYEMQLGVLWQRPTDTSSEILSVNDLGMADEIALRSAVEQFSTEPFDLACGPVLRAGLFLRQESDQSTHRVLALCVHHIAADFGSLHLLFSEIAEDLAGSAKGDVPAQYRDFIAHQHATVGDGHALRALVEKLSPLPSPLQLPWLIDARQEGGARYLTQEWRATKSESQAIVALAGRLGMTTFGVCMGLYAVLISRLASQDRFVIELASTVRQPDEHNGILGNFANLTPVPIELDSSSPVDAALKTVFSASLAALEHRCIPFPKLVDALGLSGSAVRSPLSPLAFSWHRDPHRGKAEGRTFGEVLPWSRQLGPPGALMLTGHESRDGFDFKVTYAASLLPVSFADAIRIGYSSLLDAIVSAPDTQLAELAMLDPAEAVSRLTFLRAPMLQESPVSVLERVRKIACERPHATAVIAGMKSLSYAQLWARAGEIARRLRSMGLRRGERVAVHLHRDVKLVPAILGVLLAGGVYVPVDRSYPVRRIELIISASGSRIALLDNDTLLDLPPDLLIWNLAIDPVECDEADQPVEPIVPEAELLGDLAYLIFTSGSTGTPKGVAVGHLSLANLARGLARRLDIGANTRYLAVSSISFDASIAEIFVPLAAGALLVLAGDQEVRNPEVLAALVDKHAIDTLQATPSTWKSLLARYPERHWPLRAHSMGEALPTQLARKLAPITLGVWNLYGPTEATVYVTASRYEPGAHDALATVPVATPLPGCSLWVLDAHRQPAMLGMVGELYLSGVALSRGYWQDDVLNRRSFVEISHLGDGPARFYRTGDLARYLGNGQIEIVGRTDSQVKVRGHRIDLSEVEALLANCPGVVDNVVVVIDDSLAGRRIEAFVRTKPGCDPKTIEQNLRVQCPAYMVPAAIHGIDAIPTNANGKVDRSALLRLRATIAVDSSNAAPVATTETAGRLLELIGRVLGRRVSDAGASIFDIGADSLLAVEFKLAIRDELGVDLPMIDIFERPVIALLSDYLDGIQVARAPSFSEDLELELKLPTPDRIAPALPRTILLTGATGFVGSRILGELLREPGVRVACLVRAGDVEHARKRLHHSLARHGKDLEASAWERIELVPGALGVNQFGLDAASYRALCLRVDAVVHCGALVNFSLPYASMRGNVLGTLDVARFCRDGQSKPLHFVSTYSVLDPTQVTLPEQLDVADHAFLDFGYARSKWVCERLLARAMHEGLQCRIYRPSRIVSGCRDERLNPSDFYSLVVAGSIAAGVAPVDAGSDNFVDVSGVARRIARAAVAPIVDNAAVHLCGSRWTPWREILSILVDEGVELSHVPYQAWLERVVAVATTSSGLKAFLEMRTFLEGPADKLRHQFIDRHPEIEVSGFDDGARLDVNFDRALLQAHVAQLSAAVQSRLQLEQFS